MATTGNRRLDAMLKVLIRSELGGGASAFWTAIWEGVFGRMSAIL